MKDQQQAYEQLIAVIDKHIPVGFKNVKSMVALTMLCHYVITQKVIM